MASNLCEKSICAAIKQIIAILLFSAVCASALLVESEVVAFTCILLDSILKLATSDVLQRHISLHKFPTTPRPRCTRACDACHENKVKCDGGTRCSPCTHQNTECTYNRKAYGQTIDQSLSKPRGLSSDIHTTSDPINQYTVSGDSVRSKDQTIESLDGLRSIFSVLTTSADVQEEYDRERFPHHIQSWISGCMTSYQGRFHERWPVIHVATLDKNKKPTILVATLLIIGSWFRDSKDTQTLNLSIQNVLLSKLIEDMVSTLCFLSCIHVLIKQSNLGASDDRAKPWPLELLQTAVLNIVIAFESGVSLLNGVYQDFSNACSGRAQHIKS